MLFVRRAPALFPGLQLRVPSIPTAISTRYFFDRAEVKAALTRMEHYSLSRSGLLVRRTAAKSIKKVGAALPKLKIMRDNRNIPMAILLKAPGLRASARRGLEQRIAEIKFPPASPPGTPPFTHVPHSRMLGFRRNLYNAVDLSTKSAVAGPSKKGDDWGIVHLHEFGGTKTLQQWMWVPEHPRYKTPIVKWTSMRTSPGGGRWLPTGQKQTFNYPARPYMLPALTACRPKLAKMFEGAFSAGRVGSP